MRGVTLGWLLRDDCSSDSGSDSSDAATDAGDGGGGSQGSDAKGHGPRGKAKGRGKANTTDAAAPTLPTTQPARRGCGLQPPP